MKVRFAKRFQAGGTVNLSGTLGGNTNQWAGVLGQVASSQGGAASEGTTPAGDAIAATAGGSVEGQIAAAAADAEVKSIASKLQFGVDLLDVGTDLWASKVWEKQEKEKQRDERALQEEVSKSQGIRDRAALMARTFDRSAGTAALAGAGAANIAGTGLYQLKEDDYSAIAKRVGQGIGNVLATSTAPGKAWNMKQSLVNRNMPAVLQLQPQEGVEAQGVQQLLENRQAGATTALSANQSSANYSGVLAPSAVPTAKQGAKLMFMGRRIK